MAFSKTYVVGRVFVLHYFLADVYLTAAMASSRRSLFSPLRFPRLAGHNHPWHILRGMPAATSLASRPSRYAVRGVRHKGYQHPPFKRAQAGRPVEAVARRHPSKYRCKCRGRRRGGGLGAKAQRTQRDMVS